jgi:hypothetical protein
MIGLNTECVAVARTYKISEVLDARRADNRRSDTRQRPRQGDLRHANPALFGDLFDPVEALMRRKSCRFAGKNGPIDNLLRARSFKILSSVTAITNRDKQLLEGAGSIKRHAQIGITPCRDRVSLQGTGKEATRKR